jgi:urocanate hydratase
LFYLYIQLFLFISYSLKRQYKAIDKLGNNGLIFWDYGNAFLLEVSRACAQENENKDSVSKTRFKYPSYMQDVMGDIFSLGFGPFRYLVNLENELIFKSYLIKCFQK